MVQLLQKRYQIITKLNTGGMGAVYKAKDIHFKDKFVAIKQMNSIGLSNGELQIAIKAFEQEANMLGNLVHQNLPRVYDYFEENSNFYLIMDFIDGFTLEALLNSPQTIAIKQVLSIAIKLCDVLQYLHSQHPPIVFRDLKPSNIMLTSSGHLFLIDFGIARFLKTGQIKDTQALGSPYYAAPEQFGKTQTTPKSDIYSLGVILHELLLDNQQQNTPFHFNPPLTANNLLNIQLNNLILQMVQIEPQKRPPDVITIQQQLISIQLLVLQPQKSLTTNSIIPPAKMKINHLPSAPSTSDFSDVQTYYDAKAYSETGLIRTPLINAMILHKKNIGGSLLNQHFFSEYNQINQMIALFEQKVWYSGGLQKYLQAALNQKQLFTFESKEIKVLLYCRAKYAFIIIFANTHRLGCITEVAATGQKMRLLDIAATSTEVTTWMRNLITLSQNNQLQFQNEVSN